MLPASARLTEPAAFARAVRAGRRAGSTRLVVHVDANAGESPRVGLVVSKAVGNAVVRNRVKRRLRHQCAELLPDLPLGSSLVVRALPPAATSSSAELGGELRRLLARCQAEGSR